MRRWILLAAFLPGAAFATPQDGTFVNPEGVLLSVSGAGDGGFDFSLVAGGTDAGNVCTEGDTACLQIDGHADASPKGFTYVDPNDDHSRIFFAEVPEGLRILSTIGDLGTGTENRMQKLTLRGVYAPMADQVPAAEAPAAPDATASDAPVADPATDDQLEFFTSPTGNISCLFIVGPEVSVRCDLAQLNRSFTNQPNDCGEDWGDSFGVTETSKRGELLCHGDTVADPSAQVLDYGSLINHSGITCASSKTGMTCQNGDGHGFTVARKAQQVF